MKKRARKNKRNNPISFGQIPDNRDPGDRQGTKFSWKDYLLNLGGAITGYVGGHYSDFSKGFVTNPSPTKRAVVHTILVVGFVFNMFVVQEKLDIHLPPAAINLLAGVLMGFEINALALAAASAAESLARDIKQPLPENQ